MIDENKYKAVLKKIYQHLFHVGYPYRRKQMKTDIEEALGIKESYKGRVWQSRCPREALGKRREKKV
jgi:hypothetical protein